MKAVKSYFFMITGFLSCPCHLPLTLPLLLTLTAGTALGAWLAQNAGGITVVLAIYFVIALAIGFGGASTNKEASCEVPALKSKPRESSVRLPMQDKD